MEPFENYCCGVALIETASFFTLFKRGKDKV